MSDKIYVTVIDGATNATTTVAAGTNPGEWSLAHHLFFVGVLSSRSPNYAARSQTICNYGFSIDLALYNIPPETPGCVSPALRHPFDSGSLVSFATKQAVQPVTDQYFRGYDNQFPDS